MIFVSKSCAILIFRDTVFGLNLEEEKHKYNIGNRFNKLKIDFETKEQTIKPYVEETRRRKRSKETKWRSGKQKGDKTKDEDQYLSSSNGKRKTEVSFEKKTETQLIATR